MKPIPFSHVSRALELKYLYEIGVTVFSTRGILRELTTDTAKLMLGKIDTINTVSGKPHLSQRKYIKRLCEEYVDLAEFGR